jgi:hypothetical protein
MEEVYGEFLNANGTYTQYEMRGRARKLMAKPGVHVPNKNEAKILRKIMAETGMKEAEVREHKKYRKMLSDAQKVKPSTKSDKQKAQERIMKRVTKELKLAKEHPKVVAKFNELWKEECKHRFYY